VYERRRASISKECCYNFNNRDNAKPAQNWIQTITHWKTTLYDLGHMAVMEAPSHEEPQMLSRMSSDDSSTAVGSTRDRLDIAGDSNPNVNRASMQSTRSLDDMVSLPREILVIGVISLAQFTTQVGLGQVLSILHIIAADFGVTEPGIKAWLIAGYSLTVGTFILVSGRLGDVFGYKKMLVIGYIWYAFWSMVAGLSVYSNYVLFIWARVLQGIGPSILLPNGLALLGVLYSPGRRKNMAFAVFGGVAPGGSVIGSTFGGICALAWWPWTFWSSAIVLAIIAAVAAWAVPDPPRKVDISEKSHFEVLKMCDPLGALAGVTGLVLFNFAWNQAPIDGWNAPHVIVTLILGLLVIGGFFYIELHVSSNPLIPFDALNGDTAFVLGIMACGWGAFGIWVYYLWQQLEVLRGASPLLASAYLTPLILSGVVAALTTGFLFSYIRPPWVMMMAMIAFLTSSILVATSAPKQTYWAQIFVTCIVAPFGMDLSFPAASLILSNSVSREHQGVAASLINTVVNYSISLGLGFAGTVEVNVTKGDGSFGDTLHGYRSGFYMGIGLAGLGIFLSFVFVLKSYWKDHTDARARALEEKSGLPGA
jgi:MFS family permease